MNINAIHAIPALSFDTSTLTGGWDLVGKLPYACYMVYLFNNSKAYLEVSYDGVNTNEYSPGDHTNALMGGIIPNTNRGAFPAGMPIYVKGTAEAGHFYVSGYYLRQV